jgi:hypothetical protein
MSIYDFKSSNIPSYGLGVDFGSMDRTGTLYGQNPTGLTTGKYAFLSNPDYIKAPLDIQKTIAEKELGNSSFNETLAMFKNSKPTLAEEEAKLKMAGDFQNRQQAAALPYNMLYEATKTLAKLPGEISGRAADRAMNIVLAARTAAEAGNQAALSSPRSNFQSTASPIQRNYFT